MDLKSLTTDQLTAEIARCDEAVAQASFEWTKARNVTKAAGRAETPLRNRYYDDLDAFRAARAEQYRREEILNNVGR